MRKKNLKPMIISALLAIGFGATSVGTSFALFTDSANTTINVTAGIVKIQNSMVVSAAASLNPNEAGTSVDTGAKGAHYVNGGLVEVNDSLNKVTVTNWTPGDEVTLTTTPVNGSNVDTKMRIKVVMSGELADALVITGSNGNDQSFALTGERSAVSAWKKYGAQAEVDTYSLNIKFPDHDAGEIVYGKDNKDNKYQSKQAEIFVYYEAVQGNAVTDDILERINTKLSSEAITEGKNDTMFDALADLSAEEKSAVEARGYVWHQDKDAFYDFASAPEDAYKYFKIYDEMPSSQTYSIYATGGTKWAPSVTGLKVGFDVGEITTFTSISYDRSAESSARNIKIRTNAITTAITLNGYVDANDANKGDEVRLYGLAGEVNVIQVGGNSLHTYGKVGFIKMQKGHLVVENNSDVHTVLMAPSANAKVVIDKAENGELDHAHAANQAIAESNITNGGNVIVDYDNDGATTNKHPNEVVTEEELKSEGKQAVCEHPAGHHGYVEDPDDDEKHYEICEDCGAKLSTQSEQHVYNAENVNECIYCGHNNSIKVYDVDDTSSLSAAIANYNSSKLPDKKYVIVLEDGEYIVPANFYEIDQTRINSGSSLTIKAKHMPEFKNSGYNVTLIPDASTVTDNDGSQFIFKLSGESGFANGGPINIEGIKFDFTSSALKNKTANGGRLNAVFCANGADGRYAHDLTLDYCYLDSFGGKLASFVSANKSNSVPRNITIQNCHGNKVNCFANAYGTNFLIKNCSAVEMLCLGNFQTNGYSSGQYTKIATIQNVNGSFFGQYKANGDSLDGGTENGVIYSVGGEFVIDGCTISTEEGKNATNGVFNLKTYKNDQNQTIHTEAKLTITNSTFTNGDNVSDLLVNTDTVINIVNGEGYDSYNTVGAHDLA